MMLTNGKIFHALKKIKRFISWKKYLYVKKFRNDTWYFILRYGIGDAYLVSSLLPQFMKLNGNVVVILEKENQNFIPNLFLDNIRILTKESLPYELIHEFGEFKKGEPIYLSPLHLYDQKLLLLLGANKITLLDIYKIILGLDLSTKPNKPNFLSDINYSAKKLFDKYSLPIGRTILLCPQANSIDLLDNEFWVNLANNIISFGLTPVFMNYANNDYININFPLKYSKEFCDLAGYIISLRSGFCDLIATSTAKKIILYHDSIYYSGKLIDSTSLFSMGIAESEGLLEIEIAANAGNNSLTINKIIDYIYD